MSQQPDAADPTLFDVAIIGGGASGVLVAAHLLRASSDLKLALIERNERLGSGVAYSTTRPEHLLNVTAGRMSAFEDDADHFVQYLAATDRDALRPDLLRKRYAQRRQYGEYLRSTLEQARAASRSRLEIIRDEVAGLEGTDLFHLALRSGQAVKARSVVLALGNWPRGLASITGPALADAILRGWDYDGIAGIDRDSEILIAGSGLSMVDAVLTLAAKGRRGPIHVVSRHGLLPLSNAEHGEVDLDVEAFARLPLRQRTRQLRQAAGFRKPRALRVDVLQDGVGTAVQFSRRRPTDQHAGQPFWRLPRTSATEATTFVLKTDVANEYQVSFRRLKQASVGALLSKQLPGSPKTRFRSWAR